MAGNGYFDRPLLAVGQVRLVEDATRLAPTEASSRWYLDPATGRRDT